MKKKISLLMMILAVGLLFVNNAAFADDPDGGNDYPWINHNHPFDFLFGNMIDTHQQSKLDSQGDLHGFLYIHYTGEVTAEGYPVARKANCLIEACDVGWVLKGMPITAVLLQKSPRVWLVDPADLPNQAGYSHFQWVGNPASPHGLEIGQAYSGILLRRIAPTPVFWLGGGGGGSSGGCSGCGGHDDGHSGGHGGNGGSGHDGRLVLEGIDHHSNIVTDPADVGHGGGGGCGDGCPGH
jgi:hypothetical protein